MLFLAPLPCLYCVGADHCKLTGPCNRRNHTLSMKGIHAKDLSRLNRDLARTIIIDNSPESYLLQPENAIPIKSFFGDNNDTSLLDLIPFLKDIVKEDVADVRSVLKKCHLKVLVRLPAEFVPLAPLHSPSMPSHSMGVNYSGIMC